MHGACPCPDNRSGALTPDSNGNIVAVGGHVARNSTDRRTNSVGDND
jgi:hypothetical protein